MKDLDLVAIMADHHGNPGEDCRGDDYDCPYLCPCPTYRLAEALAEAQEREQRVRALVHRWMVYSDPYHGMCSRDLVEALDGPQGGGS
jgi:hypothetical protein